MIKQISSIFLTSFLALAFVFSSGVMNAYSQDENVVDVVKESDDHTIFADLLEESQFDQKLAEEEGPFTIMAPTDEAFEEHGDVEELKENPQEMQDLVINHLFQGESSASDLETQIDAEFDEEIEASNGVVHVVEDVVQPTTN